MKIITWRRGRFGVAVGLTLGASALFWVQSINPKPTVPVVRLSGVIGGGGPFNPGFDLAGVNDQLEKAFSTKNAMAVAISINSPGGSPVQSALIADRIRSLAAQHDLQVLTFIEDYGASGGYWLALAGDEVYADSSSIVGSVGVIASSFGFAEAIKQIGVERRVLTAGNSKSMLDPFLPLDPVKVERFKGLLGEVHGDFKDYVRGRRGAKLTAKDEEVFEGQVWTGKSALKIGLIDGIGSLYPVLEEKFGDDIKIVNVSKPKPWWQRMVGFGADALVGALVRALDEKAVWARFGL